MSDLFSYTGQQLAEEGIEQSRQHADAVEPDWGDQAYRHLLAYAATHNKFAIEDVKDAAYANGLPVPPAPGAWGHVTRRAAKNEVIMFAYFRESKNASQHLKPVKVWVSQCA